MVESDRMVVFAGAGASRAVDGDAFPTTVEFFERLPREIVDDPDFSFVTSYLRIQPDKVIDIEEVLWNLERLLSFFDSISGDSDIIGYALRANRVAKISSPDYNFGNLNNVRSDRSSAIRKLISRINAIVFDLYGQTPELEKLETNWLSLLRKLPNYAVTADIFTTNYDINIETALEAGISDIDSVLGLQGRRHKTLDITNWHSSREVGGLLTKLHGSLDWKIKDDKVFVGDPLFTGDHRKQGIIYPGFKGSSENAFFKPFHDYMERRLSEAKIALFIGFAFRDEYINESIKNNLGDGATVIVLNPSKSVVFPYRRTKPQYIRGYFDDESVNAVDKIMAKHLKAASR